MVAVVNLTTARKTDVKINIALNVCNFLLYYGVAEIIISSQNRGITQND